MGVEFGRLHGVSFRRRTDNYTLRSSSCTPLEPGENLPLTHVAPRRGLASGGLAVALLGTGLGEPAPELLADRSQVAVAPRARGGAAAPVAAGVGARVLVDRVHGATVPHVPRGVHP